jgi:alpha-L-fucosidase
MSKYLAAFAILLMAGAANAQTAGATVSPSSAQSPIPRFGDGRDWFFEARFGMFIHWGIYSLKGWNEQYQYGKDVPRREYEKLAEQFNPVHFDPDAWLDLADRAGMKYICFTTKHIDGFCMWNTAQTDYNIMHTPYGRDVLAKLAEACRRREVPLALYYSLADMHHPNYPSQGRVYEIRKPDPGDKPDQGKYIEFVKAQIRELCTNYGEIHGFWWDANVMDYKDPSLNQMIRKLQPKAVINNRGAGDGDFSTPERDWDNSVNEKRSFTAPVEACQSIGAQSWGWRVNEDYYTDAHLIRSIDKILAKGGNYLLNVGPKPDGAIPTEAAAILGRIGKWHAAVKESYDHVEPAGALTGNRDVLLTRRGNVLYVHLSKEPESSAVYLHPITDLPRIAILLNTGENVETDVLDLPSLGNQKPNRCLRLKNLPVNNRPAHGWVIKLEFDHLASARP